MCVYIYIYTLYIYNLYSIYYSESLLGFSIWILIVFLSTTSSSSALPVTINGNFIFPVIYTENIGITLHPSYQQVFLPLPVTYIYSTSRYTSPSEHLYFFLCLEQFSSRYPCGSLPYILEVFIQKSS